MGHAELDVTTPGVANAIKVFSLATNFLCFSVTQTLLLVNKSEKLMGQLAPRFFSVKFEP